MSDCAVLDCARPSNTRGWCWAHYRRWLRWGDPQGRYAMQGEQRAWIDSVVERADSLVCGEADWPFTTTDRRGYGRTWVDTRGVPAHRLVLSLVTGTSPGPEVLALHSCDGPVCCAPTCLRWGTHADNTDDRVSRERGVQGERVNTAKLTAEQVRAMRDAYAAGGTSHRLLALEYGLAESSVGAILRRKNWKHV